MPNTYRIDKLKSIEIGRNIMFPTTLLQIIKEKKALIFSDFSHSENAWFGFLGRENFHHLLLF